MKATTTALVLIVLALACIGAFAEKKKPVGMSDDAYACLQVAYKNSKGKCETVTPTTAQCVAQSVVPWGKTGTPAVIINPTTKKEQAQSVFAACRAATAGRLTRGPPKKAVTSAADVSCFNGVTAVSGKAYTSLRCCPPPSQEEIDCWRSIAKKN